MLNFRWKLAALAASFFCGVAEAHSFGVMYNLPVPVWLYQYATAAALAVSFIIVGLFVNAKQAAHEPPSLELPGGRWLHALTGPIAHTLLRGLTVFTLLLCIGAGFIGIANAYLNINMTLFWIVFLLGFTYLIALVGNLYAVANPWQVMCEWLERLSPGLFAGRFAYPQRLGYAPALLLYMGLIWIELFAQTRPRSLAWILLSYTLLNFLMAWLWGRAAWFRYGELFALFLRLVGLMAPLELRQTNGRRSLHLGWPFARLLQGRAEDGTMLLFILFMLSSTAFDGLRETVPWVKIFWVNIVELLRPWIGDNLVKTYPLLRALFTGWQTFWLLASPFVYLGIYLFFVWLAKIIGRSEHSMKELALAFGFSLLPIVLVYNVTHYYTLILTQGLKIIPMLSDPFGKGWNLFGTVQWLRAPYIPDAGWVWHTQVALILIGHVVSVVLAHIVALRLFPTHRLAVLSQLPMLVLMMVFTTVGLWILAQPIQGGM